MRAGEICPLRAEHIDGKKRTAYLPETKNGLPRYMPLSDKALALLDRLKPWADAAVFGLRPASLSKLFRKAVLMAGIENLTFHDSHHEAIITRLAQKLDVLDLVRAVGHRDIKQLMTYYNKTAEELAMPL